MQYPSPFHGPHAAFPTTPPPHGHPHHHPQPPPPAQPDQPPQPGATMQMPDGQVLQYTGKQWLPTTPSKPQAPSVAGEGKLDAKELVLPGVGAFRDLGHKLDELPGVTVSCGADAAARLLELKGRLNDLQAVRKSYWTRQAGAAGAGAAGALLTLGLTVAAAGAAGLHQRSRIGQVKTAMRDVIQQINQVRAHYKRHPECRRAETQVLIGESVFTRGIDRAELNGDL